MIAKNPHVGLLMEGTLGHKLVIENFIYLSECMGLIDGNVSWFLMNRKMLNSPLDWIGIFEFQMEILQSFRDSVIVSRNFVL